MKKSVLLISLILLLFTSYGQNKTLGIGTSIPNPNAALHVESPTNNQGFIMPRLTTTQRIGMGALLTASDNGLMLYDTDLKTIYIWDGASWGSAAELTLPYKDSVLVAPANSNLLKLYYAGTTPGNVGIALFENLNPNNAFSPLFVRTSGTGSASNFFISNNTNVGSAVNGTTNGPGSAVRGINSGAGNGFSGLFQNTNAANTYPAIQANTIGTGPGIRVLQNATSLGTGLDVILQNTTGTATGFIVNQQGTGLAANINIANVTSTATALNINHSGTGNAITANRPIQATTFVGDGSGLTNLPPISFPFTTSVANPATLFDLTNTGTGKTGNFTINNATSASSALTIASNATGYAFQVRSTGTGENALFEVSNASSAGSPVVALTNGTGLAGLFQVNNPAGGTALEGLTNSNVGGVLAPVGVYGLSTGTGSLGGSFRITNAGNGYPALYAETNGTGYAIMAKQTNATSGNAGYFEVSNVSNPANGVYAKTYGTGTAVGGLTTGSGTAGRFEITNGVNTQSALEAVTDGLGSAISANNNGGGFGIYARATGSTDAIYAEKQATDGNGSAGNFWIKNPGNGASTLFAATDAAAGSAMGLINSADGNALTIYQGGLKISNVSLSTPGPIVAKAGLYEISTAGSYTLPATGSVGETCWVANSSGGIVTINAGPTVSNGTIRQFIRLTGGWQIVN